jgi:EmrB/QacA subfamily drug resistance transporter
MDPGATSINAAIVAGRAGLRDRLRVVLVGLGISVVPLDTAVNIAFPDITGSFGLPIAMIQWVVICYVLTHAGLMLAFGRVGDMWSHDRVFRAGLAWSIAAFLLCAAAPSYGWLLFFRVLQGIGAGLIISCAPALVTSLYPEARRSHALGIFTLMFALGSAMGPLIGGALVARWGWPAVFWFRAPVALTSLLLLRGLPRAPRSGRSERFDILGALLLAFGLAALLLAINALPRIGRGDYLGPAMLVVAAASLVSFVIWEGRAAQPIIRLQLFRSARFTLVNISSALMYLMTFSVMLIGPYFIKPVLISNYGHAWGGVLAGVVLAGGFVAMAAASPLAGALVARLGPQWIAPFGALAAGLGLFSVGSWEPETPIPVLLLSLAIQGVGTGLFQVAYMEIVMAASPLAHRGVAGSLSMLTRTIGVVTGAAVLTLAFQTVEATALGSGATKTEAFMTAFQTLFRICGIAAALTGALAAWPSRAERKTRTEEGL